MTKEAEQQKPKFAEYNIVRTNDLANGVFVCPPDGQFKVVEVDKADETADILTSPFIYILVPSPGPIDEMYAEYIREDFLELVPEDEIIRE